ncbi:MAG: L-fucose isomerase [Lentisphaerae bacterium]|jgi:L-fucose/D-arabinose isomerase|nr:L-fucose isomerase [Lentisphaerota bacterium]MBT4820925.1 L-fucose isomerase [Lentisphaerota bacterium]MBT5611495.1 L-fucose isomerase [Lentisphaerota bacterium]MBT7056357.1 L-fucose isomerase [Lentisphaerota bacterium]MBT7842967.1 L-fucose isomerase [Lentisphaerota bacterium]
MADASAFKMTAPVNRLRGGLPKIGIRPTIDGRLGGVRESLEDQTMNMAKGAAEFLSANLTHACGLPVECVMPDACIGGATEAAACAEMFTREGVGVSLTVTPCWCYGSETMDMDPTLPKAVWGFNGTERPGAVYLAAVLAAHSQKGVPAFGIYGHDVQEASDTSIPENVQVKLLRFARAGLAAARMRGKSYLSMGSVSMGIAGSIVNHEFFEEFLGMRVECVDMTEFVRRFDREIYDKEEYERALAWVKANCIEGDDPNDPEVQHSAATKERCWELCVKMAIIARDLMVGNPNLAAAGYGEEALGRNAILAGFQGQRQWTDHLPNGDFMEAMLNSSFDWNGIRQPYLVATENDCLNGVSMLFGHLLTNTAQVFADVRTYWSPDAIERVTGKKPTGVGAGGLIHLINSGPAAIDGTGEQEADGKPALKPFWDVTPDEAADCLNATQFCYAELGYFSGGGYSTDFTTKADMPVTMTRLNLVKGLGPVLQIAEGYTVELDDDMHDALDLRTNPTWPTTWFAPRLTGEGPFKDVYSVMNNWGANHGAFSYGHIGADIITLASILRIPVCMHNVNEDDIFRPSAWNAFGMDKEGSDYRACEAFGALYG